VEVIIRVNFHKVFWLISKNSQDA